jgi:hypothetical protein
MKNSNWWAFLVAKIRLWMSRLAGVLILLKAILWTRLRVCLLRRRPPCRGAWAMKLYGYAFAAQKCSVYWLSSSILVAVFSQKSANTAYCFSAEWVVEQWSRVSPILYSLSYLYAHAFISRFELFFVFEMLIDFSSSSNDFTRGPNYWLSRDDFYVDNIKGDLFCVLDRLAVVLDSGTRGSC